MYFTRWIQINKIEKYKKSKKDGKPFSDIEMYLNFLNQEVAAMENFDETLLNIISWKDIRKYIVHYKPNNILPGESFLHKNYLEIKYSVLKFSSKNSVINFFKLSSYLLNNLSEIIIKKFDLIEYSIEKK